MACRFPASAPLRRTHLFTSDTAGRLAPPDGRAQHHDAPDVRLRDLVKRYGELAAVDGVDLDIAHGEFFTLLGPSGSGKTTTLRLIAGFELPDEGGVELGGRARRAAAARTRATSTRSSRTTRCSRT